MAKMMGKSCHRNQCDCKCKFVSGADEKCGGKVGVRRQRAREKVAWKRDLTSQMR